MSHDIILRNPNATATIPFAIAFGGSGEIYEQSVYDSFGLADSVSSTFQFYASIADTVTVSDTVAFNTIFIISAADVFSLTDVRNTAAQFTRSMIDAVVVTDVRNTAAQCSQSLVDNFSISGVVGWTVSYSRSLEDVYIISDLVEASVGQFVTIAVDDSFSLSDLIITKHYSKTLLFFIIPSLNYPVSNPSSPSANSTPISLFDSSPTSLSVKSSVDIKSANSSVTQRIR